MAFCQTIFCIVFCICIVGEFFSCCFFCFCFVSFVFLNLVSTASSVIHASGCYHLHDYNYNSACFQFPGRNTNYSHPHLSHIEDTSTNIVIITAFIGMDPAVCYEAVISVSCLLSNMPCSSENNNSKNM